MSERLAGCCTMNSTATDAPRGAGLRNQTLKTQKLAFAEIVAKRYVLRYAKPFLRAQGGGEVCNEVFAGASRRPLFASIPLASQASSPRSLLPTHGLCSRAPSPQLLFAGALRQVLAVGEKSCVAPAHSLTLPAAASGQVGEQTYRAISSSPLSFRRYG